MTAPIRIAIVGLGKIAHDQHLPAIAASDRFTLVAAASHAGSAMGIPVFPTLAALLEADISIDALSMCQPPQARCDDAMLAIRAGKHVLLEKPPGATLAEVEAIDRLAQIAGTTLFAAWHSRFAAGVGAARDWLSRRRIESVSISWKEDVRRWHPGQSWIWRAGGMGVFDPGINALSIATEILPFHIFLREGEMMVPANCEAPIAVDLRFAGTNGCPVHATFDFQQEGPQHWDIVINTDAGPLQLADGGATLIIDGIERIVGRQAEYAAVYRRFAQLIDARRSEVDEAPLRLVADAFLRCRRVVTAAFIE